MRRLAVACTGAALLGFPIGAVAEDRLPFHVEGCTAPCAGYEVSTELQNDWVFAADPSFLTSDELEPTITVDLFLAPTDNLRFVASIITEHVVEPDAGENAVFQGIGTYLAELYATIETGPATIRAGKFDTIFSLASEITPGINATELVSDIDADERLGAEVVLDFGGLGMEQALAATAFGTDRSVLSNSLFTQRGRTGLSDGGAGNTDGLSSFSITLDGCRGAAPSDCYLGGDFGYRLGIRYQAAGVQNGEEPEDSTGDELAYLAAATTSLELDEMTLRLIGETAYLRHFDGGSDDALLFTGSAALHLAPVTYVASYTQQLNLVAGEPDTREHLADFEAIYEPQGETSLEGWAFAAAYTLARDADETAHIFSVRAVFNFDGDVELGSP